MNTYDGPQERHMGEKEEMELAFFYILTKKNQKEIPQWNQWIEFVELFSKHAKSSNTSKKDGWDGPALLHLLLFIF